MKSALKPWLCLGGACLAFALFSMPRLDAQAPPSAMIPCGSPPGAAAGGPPPGGGPGGGPALPLAAPLSPAAVTAPAAAAVPAGLRLTKVQADIHLLTGAGGNITIHSGSEGVLLVDSGRAGAAAGVIAAVRSISAKPIRLIINTAADTDHTGGNEVVSRAGSRIITAFGRGGGSPETPGAAIMARQAVQNRMIAEQAPECALPTTTYDVFPMRSHYFNGEGIELRHMPAAHSDGDSFVYFRRSDVVVTGDIFNTNLYPVIDVEHGGSIAGTVAALNELLEITIPALNQEGGTMVVPGHGRLADEADVSEYRDMVTIVRDRVRAMVAKRMTLEQVKAQRPTLDYDGRYGATEGPSTTDQFVEAVYRGVSQAAAAPRANGGRR